GETFSACRRRPFRTRWSAFRPRRAVRAIVVRLGRINGLSALDRGDDGERAGGHVEATVAATELSRRAREGGAQPRMPARKARGEKVEARVLTCRLDRLDAKAG